jgi:glucosamine--fructose-6-phosphate aminotransferase (isomerizing)
MLKEIHEQPGAEDTARRIDPKRATVAGEMGLDPDVASQIGRVYLVACGTSHYATMAGRHWIEQPARVPAVTSSAAKSGTGTRSSARPTSWSP